MLLPTAHTLAVSSYSTLLDHYPQLDMLAAADNLGDWDFFMTVAGVGTAFMTIPTITELAPYLSTKERNLLHVAYERLRVGDEILASYAADLLNALKEKVMGDPWQAYIDRITGQIDSYKVVRELLRSYLDGEPIDVFHLNLSEDERKRASFR